MAWCRAAYVVQVEGDPPQSIALKPANMQALGPLLPGWQEMPSPEGTYYYHATTGESTWDRPKA